MEPLAHDEPAGHGAQPSGAAPPAAVRNVPAYVIFPDRTLMELAAVRPQSLNEMSDVHGVGAVKLEKYGGEFIEAIRNFAGGG